MRATSAATRDARATGRRGGEGVTTLETGADRALVRLADAILIPPFPGHSVPAWIREALGRGLAGVTLFGPNISAPDQVSTLTAALRAAAGDDDPVIAIDEEGGDVTRVARPDTVLVEMGLPLWQPPEGACYLATYGASRASARAAAELLGLA
jgi:hypothetical protein